LQFYQQFLKERGDDPTLNRELAGVYSKVGEIYRDLGQLPAAAQANAEALRLYKALVAQSPEDADLQFGLAVAQSRIGLTSKAISILEKLIDPENPKYHAALGELYNTASNEASRTNPTPAALDFLRKSLAVRERLVRLSPDDPDAHLGLSASLNNIAVQLKEDRGAEAFVLLKRSHEEDEIAYRLRPSHLLTISFMSIGLLNLADYAKKLGENDVALALRRRQVEILDRRARENPTIPWVDPELLAAYSNWVLELQLAGRLEEASKAADKGSVRITEMNSETPAYFSQVANFRLSVHRLAVARAKVDPAAQANVEPAAAAAVDAMRQYLLAN
jgi:tetratricopeptide (TPR) repeat protein